MNPKYSKVPDEHQEGSQIQYFTPRKVVFQLKHPSGLARGSIAEAFERFLADKPTTEESWKDKLIIPEQEALLNVPVESEQGDTYTLVPTWMQDEEAGQEELIELLLNIVRDLMKPVQISNDISLNSVAPNWLLGSSPHQAGLAGPGAWPEMAEVPVGYLPRFGLPASQEMGHGEEMHVAILDTAPRRDDLIVAYEKWHAIHPLINSLLKPDGPLNLYSANSAARQSLLEYSLLDHRYRMPDHGLFVAGIVHTIAPAATLHLYEVLNPFGVGSIETIAKGLIDVLENPDIGRPLIVNCSLVLGVSPDENYNPDLPAELAKPNVFSHLTKSIREVFDLLAQQYEIVLVAAAGNDAAGHDGKPGRGRRPPARYPAALESVVGVGALPKEDPPQGQRHRGASYSNLSDNPAKNGFITLGGEPGKQRGVLGVYIGDFPEYCGPLPATKDRLTLDHVHYQFNESGWAWWAGTSFATPIISGMLTAWWGANPGAEMAEVRNFLRSVVAANTDEEENVVSVKQQVP